MILDLVPHVSNSLEPWVWPWWWRGGRRARRGPPSPRSSTMSSSPSTESSLGVLSTCQNGTLLIGFHWKRNWLPVSIECNQHDGERGVAYATCLDKTLQFAQQLLEQQYPKYAIPQELRDSYHASEGIWLPVHVDEVQQGERQVERDQKDVRDTEVQYQHILGTHHNLNHMISHHLTFINSSYIFGEECYDDADVE